MTALAELQAALTHCRANGFATAPEEETLGINALAAPLLNDPGVAAGTLAIVGSIQHILAQPSEAQVTAVLRTARAISQTLGFSGVMPS